MDERFLQYIWYHQRYDVRGAVTTDDQKINIYQPGQINWDSGPDFANAKVRIGDIIWNGSVEIHVNSTDWFQHKHHEDPAYDGVILHVVWDAREQETVRADGTRIPTMELKHLVEQDDLLRFNQLHFSKSSIPCANQIHRVEQLTLRSMVDRALVARLQEKTQSVTGQLKKTGNDWEETSYRLLSRNFGFNKNGEIFLRLAEKLPFRILKKHADSLKQTEALLFGMAGFLDRDLEDDYFRELRKEYGFLAHKYHLDARAIQQHQWKTARMRPANFPVVRLAQFASIISSTPNLFSLLIHESDPGVILNAFDKHPSGYWNNRLDFGEALENFRNKLGKASIENIIINTVAPLLAAYSKHHGQPELMDRAVELLQQLKPERNFITRSWTELGVRMESAFDSQGFIGLYKHFCMRKQCVHCNIGVALLSR